MEFCCGARLLVALSLCAAMACAAWLDVPFVRQEKNGCGAASIAMLMRYWARDASAAADPVRIQAALYSPDVEGIRGADVDRYFRQNGFTTFVFKGAWSDLEQHLAKRRPLMVCLKEGSAATLHYVVVAGIESDHGLVLVNDPARRKLAKLDRANFEKRWRSTGNWTLLAVPEPAR